MEEFDYGLPPAAIAQDPAEPRDRARLLVDGGEGRDPSHLRVRDLPDLLGPGDVVVVNETRVLAARLRLLRSTGGAVEVLLVRPDGRGGWETLVRPSRKVAPGEVLTGADHRGLTVVAGERLSGGMRSVTLSLDGSPITDPEGATALDGVGEMPLPPYITAGTAPPQRYQTVYATVPGSVAAPTAGLHLTEALLGRIQQRGARVQRVELVVGIDTFRPVTVSDTADHVMHTERYRVPEVTMEACAGARRVVAVGTTTVRALESAAATGRLEGDTDLFITRGHRWAVVDALMTNFHLPRSTLLVMIDAFIGPRWRELYSLALDHGYRFLSYGDAMFLTRHPGSHRRGEHRR